MRLIVCVTALLLVICGLWSHDWRDICAGLAVAIVWPVVADDLRRSA